MKELLFLLAALWLGLTACRKQETPTPQPAPLPSIIRSDTGSFMPFGLGSTWTYEKEYYDTSSGTPSSSSGMVIHTHQGSVVIDNKEYFDMNGAYVRLQNGVYYKYLNDRNGETPIMIENPTVGAVWKDTTLTDAHGLFSLLHTYTVVAVGQTLTVPAGTFNQVVEIEVEIKGYQDATNEKHYYQAGVGLLQQEISHVHFPRGSWMQLQSYLIN